MQPFRRISQQIKRALFVAGGLQLVLALVIVARPGFGLPGSPPPGDDCTKALKCILSVQGNPACNYSNYCGVQGNCEGDWNCCYTEYGVCTNDGSYTSWSQCGGGGC